MTTRQRLYAGLLTAAMLLSTQASAQFTGPDARGQDMTAAAAQGARPGTYVTLSGNIVSHLRADYYLFRDGSGELRVEIDDGLWRGREVSPETTVRLLGEIDRSGAGVTYVWIKQLDIAS